MTRPAHKPDLRPPATPDAGMAEGCVSPPATSPPSARQAARELMQISWKNAWRAIRLGFRFPVQLIASILLACVAAACWGGNIAAIYPVLEVTLRGQSLQSWTAERIAEQELKIGTLRQELDEARAALQAEPNSLRRADAVAELEQKLQSEERALHVAARMRPYVSRLLPDDPFQTVLLVMLAVVAVTVVKNLCVMGSTWLSSRVTQDIVMGLRQEFFEAILKTDPESFTKRGTGQLWSRFVQDIPYLSMALAALYGRAVSEPLKILSCTILAAWLNWRLLVVSLIVTPPALLGISWLGRRVRACTVSAYDQDAHSNTLVFEVLQGLPTVQAYTMEAAERRRFLRAAQNCWNIAMRVVMLRALSKPAVELLGIIVICTGVVAGAHLVLNEGTHLLGIRISDRPMQVTGLLWFFGTLIGIYDPLRKLGEVLPQIQMGLAAADRLFPILDAAPRVVEVAHPRPLPTPHRELTFERVQFHYQPTRPVLKSVDLTIPFGETIALVGPNGCGKTTLVNLIPRFFDPVGGAVRIDGVDLREARLADIRRKIGLVTQHAHLFDDTVLENIRYGKPEATLEEVVAAAERAHAHEFIIRQLAQGYETKVGHGGSRLSGGQRQRIALARAILRDPEILILDEPTSQIDLQSERLIQEVLSEFVVGRTAIVITHRLSLLALAQRIVVMQQGQIIDIGRHEELLDRCVLYRRLHQLDGRPHTQTPRNPTTATPLLGEKAATTVRLVLGPKTMPHTPPPTPTPVPRNARILVTGHRGLVGSAVVRHLRSQGFEHILTATREEMDLRAPYQVEKWFQEHQPEYVIHCAGKVGGILANARAQADFLYDNLLIQATVLRSAWRSNVTKLLYLGSSCIYPRDCPQPIKEEYLLTGPLEQTNYGYALAKIAGVKSCDAYREQYGCRFISAMPTNLYGPNDNFDPVTSHVLPALIRRFHEAKQAGRPSVTIWGSGEPRREFLHVDDLARACLHLLEHYDAPGPINVGTGVDVSIRELAEIIRDIVYPDCRLEFDRSKPDGTPRKLLDVSRLHALGFRHEIALADGIRSTYAWFLEHPAAVEQPRAVA